VITRRDMIRASGALALGSTAFVVGGCATVGAAAAPRHRVLSPGIALTAPRGLPDEESSLIERALPDALARLSAYGFALREPVLLRLHADVASFRAATGKREDWLRAWAGYDTVDLLPTTTWADAEWPAPVERLAHELAHCAMFQSFGDAAQAGRARVPFFFSEGTASVVAGQERRRLPLVDTARRSLGGCPLVPGTLATDHLVAYSAAHHAMAFVADRFGARAMADVCARAALIRGPGCVEQALLERTSLTPCALWNLVALPAL
jgi:hypothetical protein